jgi:ATP-binding cassette subfamily B protein
MNFALVIARLTSLKKEHRRPTRPGVRLFFAQLQQNWLLYLGGALGICLTNSTELAFPKFMQWAIDTVLTGSSEKVPHLFRGGSPELTIARLSVGLFLVALLGIFSRGLWRQCLARRSHWSGYWLRKNLWDSVCDQPLSLFSKYPIGDLINRCISDINPARFVLGFTQVATWDIVFYAVLGTFSLFLIDQWIALSAITLFLALPFLIQGLVKKEFALHDTAQSQLSQLSDRITQMVATVRLQRASAMEDAWVRVLTEDAQLYADKKLEVEKVAWKTFPYGGGATFLCYVFIFAIGLPQVADGSMTVGQLVSALSLVLLLQGPLFSLSEIIAEWQKGLASLNRIAEILELKSQGLAALKAAPTPSSILVKDLYFAYGRDRAPILTGFHLCLLPGKSMGICGEIGAGKSTLLSLLCGLESSLPGSIRVFGKDIMSTPRHEITQLINLVPQKPFLFAGSIRDNLSLDATFTSEELWSILDEMCLGNDFRALASGLDTPVGEWGISLSGGQRQRMALARALLRPKPILLLDDCLSAVDSITEERIVLAIKQRIHGVSVIWVAHRPSTLALCDEVFELKNGALTAREVSIHG